MEQTLSCLFFFITLTSFKAKTVLLTMRVSDFQCYYNEECVLDGALCETHVYDRSRVRFSAVDRVSFFFTMVFVLC